MALTQINTEIEPIKGSLYKQQSREEEGKSSVCTGLQSHATYETHQLY